MSYIAELRALVGTRPLVLPGTSVVVVDERGYLLLVRRTEIAGWGLPGGFMEPGESFEEAGIRETREETGLQIEDLRLLGVFSGAGYYYRYPHGDEVYNVTAAYVARPGALPLVVDGAELSGAAYFAPDALPAGIISPELPIVEHYVAEERKRT